jgi:hypothetical protein
MTNSIRISVYVEDVNDNKKAGPFGYAIPDRDWFEVRPPRRPILDIMGQQDAADRARKRDRLVNMIAMQIADAMLSELEKQ